MKASAAMENRRAAKSNALMPPLSLTTTLHEQSQHLVSSIWQDICARAAVHQLHVEQALPMS